VKLDYNLTSKMKFYARGSLVREPMTRILPPSFRRPPFDLIFTDHSYAYVFVIPGTISNTKINQFVYGENRQVVNFPYLYKPLATTVFNFDRLGTGSNYLTSPYMAPSSQGRTIPIPIFRDDFTYVRASTLRGGRHFQAD